MNKCMKYFQLSLWFISTSLYTQYTRIQPSLELLFIQSPCKNTSATWRFLSPYFLLFIFFPFFFFKIEARRRSYFYFVALYMAKLYSYTTIIRNFTITLAASIARHLGFGVVTIILHIMRQSSKTASRNYGFVLNYYCYFSNYYYSYYLFDDDYYYFYCYSYYYFLNHLVARIFTRS